MKFRISIILFLTLSFSVKGQHSIKAQLGFGYQEHVALGAGIIFKDNYSISALYGSNFIIHPQKFSAVFLQIDRKFNSLAFKGWVPRLGVKAGNMIYSDEYYKWKVITCIPFLGIDLPLKGSAALFLEAGPAISFEYSVTRISYGEIGHYRKLLPEIKLGLNYIIGKK